MQCENGHEDPVRQTPAADCPKAKTKWADRDFADKLNIVLPLTLIAVIAVGLTVAGLVSSSKNSTTPESNTSTGPSGQVLSSNGGCADCVQTPTPQLFDSATTMPSNYAAQLSADCLTQWTSTSPGSEGTWSLHTVKIGTVGDPATDPAQLSGGTTLNPAGYPDGTYTVLEQGSGTHADGTASDEVWECAANSDQILGSAATALGTPAQAQAAASAQEQQSAAAASAQSAADALAAKATHACDAYGGQIQEDASQDPSVTCDSVVALDDQGYNVQVVLDATASGRLVVSPNNVGVLATEADCSSGNWSGGADAGRQTPGHWNAAIGLCFP